MYFRLKHDVQVASHDIQVFRCILMSGVWDVKPMESVKGGLFFSPPRARSVFEIRGGDGESMAFAHELEDNAASRVISGYDSWLGVVGDILSPHYHCAT